MITKPSVAQSGETLWPAMLIVFPQFISAPRRAKALIDDIVSRGHESSNGQTGSMQEMIIPAGKAGLIIGKGGETIKQLQVRLEEMNMK